MSDILRTSMAPISDAAWTVIREEAERTFKGHLSGRRIADVEGPHGPAFASVNLGRLRLLDKEPVPGVGVGVRQVLPIVEARIPFTLDQWELDNAARGAADVDVTPVIEAARKLATFEEGAVYGGFPDGGIAGVLTNAPHKPVPVAPSPDALVEAVESGIVAMQEEGIGGPYALVLDTETYARVEAGAVNGYPIRGRIAELANGGVHWSPAIGTGALVSVRGGDFVLTLGQDISIGYAGHGDGKVELFFTESFTFRVLEPAAALAFKKKA